MKSKKTTTKANEDALKQKLMSQLEDACKIARNAGEPTYRFEAGERVNYGSWQRAIVKEVLLDGTAYHVECSTVEIKYGIETEKVDEQIVPWLSLRPRIPAEERTSAFSFNDNVRLSYSNTTIESLMSRHYHFGIEFEPPYQRGYVWTQTDKDMLLEYIFMGAQIGRFVLKRRSDEEWRANPNVSYEIIDGKQRLLTLLSFYENRWAYKGVFFNELSNADRRRILDMNVAVAEVRNLSYEDTLKLFLRLNRGGRQVSDDIIEHVKDMLENCG